jgi:hypothetical protein
MARRVKEYVEISDYTSLDAVLEQLKTVRAALDDGASPEIAMRGDDFFGQRLTITFLRELTRDEAALERKYSPERCRQKQLAGPARPRNTLGARRRAAQGRA